MPGANRRERGMEIERIRTYIEGFDDKLNGGIPKRHVVLLAGEPGTMKSSVAYNILYNNAKYHDIKGVYVTLEQGRESLLVHMENLGMKTDDVEKNISVVDLSLIRKNLEKLGQQTWMQIFKMYAQNLKNNMDYDVLILDSLPVLELLADFEDARNELFHFFEWLRELEVTTFLITEMPHASDKYAKNGEDFLADGIIHLKMERVDDVNIQRRIRAVKMRSTNHSPNYYTLLFEDGKFQATRVISDRAEY